ncbi:hypothetical protein IGI04_000780, partial [Brassica rapa subsp. trilocularis]
APFNCNFPTIDVDVVGHMKLLNEQMLIQRPVLHEVAIATTQRQLRILKKIAEKNRPCGTPRKETCLFPEPHLQPACVEH